MFGLILFWVYELCAVMVIVLVSDMFAALVISVGLSRLEYCRRMDDETFHQWKNLVETCFIIGVLSLWVVCEYVDTLTSNRLSLSLPESRSLG